MKIYKIRVESFEPYGLNKYKNFLDEGSLSAHSEDEIIGWAEGILTNNGIDEDMAIFIHAFNDNMYAVVKEMNYEDEEFYITKIIGDGTLDFFAKLDADYNFACYGLIMQEDKTTWAIIDF